MKTVKTVMGLKKIDAEEDALIIAKLRVIIQEHRSILIDKLIAGGLVNYIDYKLNRKATLQQVREIATRLDELKGTRVDEITYAPIFEAVNNNEFTNLDNKIFYMEIDWIIQSKLFQPEFFREAKQVFINDHNYSYDLKENVKTS